MTVISGVLHNTIETLEVALKSSLSLITHLLSAAAIGVGSLRLTSCNLELDQLPIAKVTGSG